MRGSELSASGLQLWGAGGFGALVGWYLYYINRRRTGEVQIADFVSVIGAIGGGAVLALFPSGTDLFGAYGIGLFTGFFGYLLVLAILVRLSPNFDVDFFIDGRRIAPKDGELPGDPTGAAMNDDADDQVRR